jgi:hypothetical protein
MGWYDSDWTRRIPISVVNTGGAGTIDISGAVQSDLDYFWNSVDTNGEDVRITEADGVSPITFAAGNCTGWDLGGAFSKANRVMTLRIDGWTGATATANICQLLWMYFGATGKASAVDGTVALAAPETAYFEDQNTLRYPIRFGTRSPRPGATEPNNDFQKSDAEELHVGFDFSQEMILRGHENERSMLYEEIETLLIDAGAGAVPDATLYDRTKARILDRHLAVGYFKAGVSGNNKWIEAKVVTSLGRTLARRASMRVQNITEAT